MGETGRIRNFLRTIVFNAGRMLIIVPRSWTLDEDIELRAAISRHKLSCEFEIRDIFILGWRQGERFNESLFKIERVET
jgi:hypothetical protein